MSSLEDRRNSNSGSVTAAAVAARPMALGIDMGAATTRIALLDPSKPMPTIVRNDLSNEATSTVVCYAANEARCYGETAASRSITKPSETVIDLAPWLFGSSDDTSVVCNGGGAVGGNNMASANNSREMKGMCLRTVGEVERHPVQMAAYFIKSILRFVPGNVGQFPVCLAIPTAATDEAAVALRQACLLAGISTERTLIAPSDEAMAVYLHHMQYRSLPDENATATATTPVVEGGAEAEAETSATAAAADRRAYVTILDVGQSCVSACVLAVTRQTITKLSSHSLRLGSGFIDGALCSHVYGEIAKKFGAAALQGDVKSFRKILRECRKAKEILSTVEETQMQLEALQGHMDITIALPRAKVEELARPFTDALKGMLVEVRAAMAPAIAAAAGAEEPRVEVVGGGWRSTFVSTLIRRELGVERLGVSLDANLAVAEGSAILAEICSPMSGVEGFTSDNIGDGVNGNTAAGQEGEEQEEEGERTTATAAAVDSSVYESHRVSLVGFVVATPGSPASSPLSAGEEATVAEWATTEEALAALDAAIHARAAAMNRLDSFVLQTLQTVDECAEDKDDDDKWKEAARAYLYELDHYVQDDCHGADTAAVLARLDDVTAHVTATFPGVERRLGQLRTAAAAKEEELIRLSKEQEAEGKELKSDPQRLRAAQKRREQGAQLFTQEHWQEAQTRFVQALAILGELYDVSENSPETRATRDAIALSCHLNIASCSVRLQLWRNAVNNCTSALELSPGNAKAYFRRGQANMGCKELGDAVADLEKAAALSGGDAAVAAELAAAKRALEAQRAKEKKMFAKMFS